MPKDDKATEKPLSPELEQIKELYDVMLEKGLDVLEVKEDDTRVRLTRRFLASSPAPFLIHQSAHPKAASAGASAEVAVTPGSSEPSGPSISSPLAGVFYRASSPTSAAFAKEGDVVDVGQTLCIIEAMKVMNEIKADTRCRIVKIVAENGRPVSAGQTLFQTASA